MYELLLMNGLPEFVVGRIAKEFQNGVFLFNTDTQGYGDILDFTRNNYPVFLWDKENQNTVLDFEIEEVLGDG